MPCGRSTRMNRCIPSGTTSGIAGIGTPACGSTICSSPRIWRPGSPKRASIGGCAPKKEQAITRQLGSSSGKGIERAREPSCRSRNFAARSKRKCPGMIRGISSLMSIRQRRNRLRSSSSACSLKRTRQPLRRPCHRVIEQDSFPAVVDDVIVRILRLAADCEEAAVGAWRDCQGCPRLRVRRRRRCRDRPNHVAH